MNAATINSPKVQEHMKKLGTWCRLRIMNYAEKKNMTYNQALNSLFRKNKEEQVKELDSVVDEKFHSSKEPQLLQ